MHHALMPKLGHLALRVLLSQGPHRGEDSKWLHSPLQKQDQGSPVGWDQLWPPSLPRLTGRKRLTNPHTLTKWWESWGGRF